MPPRTKEKRTWITTAFGIPRHRTKDMFHSIDQSKLVQGMAWWGLGTGIQGILQGKVLLGSGVSLGALIAFCYWWKPCPGWRRTLDMAWIQGLLWTHAYSALSSPVRTLYFSIQALGALLYCLGWVFLNRGDTWMATFLHMGLTACANLSLNVLYAYPL